MKAQRTKFFVTVFVLGAALLSLCVVVAQSGGMVSNGPHAHEDADSSLDAGTEFSLLCGLGKRGRADLVLTLPVDCIAAASSVCETSTIWIAADQSHTLQALSVCLRI